MDRNNLSNPVLYTMEEFQHLSRDEIIKKLITAQNLIKFLSNRTEQPHKQVSKYLDVIPHQPPKPKNISQYLDTPTTTTPKTHPNIKTQARALKGSTKSYSIEIIKKTSPLEQLNSSRTAANSKLLHDLEEMKGLKFVETLRVELYKQVNKEHLTYKMVYFNSTAHTIINSTEIVPALNKSAEQVITTIGKWLSEGSGWIIDRVFSHFINITKYKPCNGTGYIQLPIELQNSRKGLINMKNTDNECFRWCHLRHLNPVVKNPGRVTKLLRQAINNVNYDGIKFPVATNQYNKIEKQNNIRINVFGYEAKQPYPIYISKEKFDDQLDLLLLTEEENSHYCLIEDFNRFMCNQTEHKEKKHFCKFCLQCFSSEIVLNNHTPTCLIINGEQAIKMPSKGAKVKFANYNKQLEAPFVIYADFEAITEKIDTARPTPASSSTTKYQQHTDCGYGYKLVCCDDKFSKPVQIYRGKNAVNKFLSKMIEEAEYCKQIKEKHFNQEMIIAPKEEQQFKKSTKCHICNKKYTTNDKKVRDHCHITGRYRGSAHELCNLNYRISDKIPVIFHNLRGYDSHFIMQEIGKFKLDVNVIPNNMEKYMAFMLGKHLTFLDSFQFMSSALDRLVNNLPPDSFKYTNEEFKNKIQATLMKKKGAYPYDYMDSFNKFKQTTLPQKDEFYSILADEHISNEAYDHAKQVWKVFKLKNMGEYHDLYLKSDVLLLADVFEQFRKTCLKSYKLDPCHYFTSPGLSWDAMLKMTDVKLDLMSDVDMYQFIEKGMRGGISCVTHRYGSANNKYMQNHDKSKPSKYIMYMDANNLYGWAMSQFLPTGGFRWLTEKEINKKNLAAHQKDNKKGMILEVDLEYPEELHDAYNSYPLAPEHLAITEDMLSPYCKQIKEKYHMSAGEVKKLIPNLMDKTKYVLHYRNLQLYIDLGLKIKKIHRVLEFNQSPWLEQYISFNTNKRTVAKNDFEKDFFKLMNNSVFGKTMENLRKRVNVKLITDEKKLIKYSSKPTFISSKIFNEKLVAIHNIKPSLLLNRPAFVGMCILDLSKTLMYDFHYNYIVEKYKSKAKLLFTDTDSLMYEIETNDVYKDFYKNKEKFDNSDYPQTNKYFFKENKKVIGKFKDEAASTPIVEFVGLRSKMYSYMKDNKLGGKTAKGIKKNIVKNDIHHENYKDVLLNKKQLHHTMKAIRSEKHQLGSYEINKVSLSCYDDKRYLLEDGITSYAYGHFSLML